MHVPAWLYWLFFHTEMVCRMCEMCVRERGILSVPLCISSQSSSVNIGDIVVGDIVI